MRAAQRDLQSSGHAGNRTAQVTGLPIIRTAFAGAVSRRPPDTPAKGRDAYPALTHPRGGYRFRICSAK